MKTIKTILIALMMLLSTISVYGAFDERCTTPSATFVNGYGCVEPKVKIVREVYASDSENIQPLASSTGILGGDELDPIKITNPWAAQGQPVIVKFTLENIGDQFGYPYNTIELPPNNYVLMMGVDKDIGVRTKDGVFVNIWDYMTVWERMNYLLGTSSAEFQVLAKNTLKGEQCGYVDASKYMSDRVKDYVAKRTGDRAVYQWHCLKIVDKAFYAQEIKSYCSNKIDSACTANLNTDFGNSVSDTVQVLLSGSQNGEISRGQCVRPHSGSGFWGFFKKVSLPTVKWNQVQCNMGDDGLQPGQSITFDFVIMVPSDAPIVNPSDLTSLEGYNLAETGGYTYSAVCKDDQNAKACHSIYAGVWPAKNENWVNTLLSGAFNELKLGSCIAKNLFSAKKINLCAQTHGFDVDAVGEPIWEGSGIFYIVGPVLKGSIELMLWAAYLAGGLVGFTGRKS